MVAFALAGAALFWLFDGVVANSKPTIAVSEEFVSQLVAERELVLERSLSDSEVEQIRRGFIDQEVLVREAMARRLYLNDGQVRHRLADKMFYLLSDDVDEPSESELDAFYELRRADYRTPELITFSQHFYGTDEARAKRALSMNGDIVDDGERFYMGGDIVRFAPADLLPIFGLEFTRELGDLPVGDWQGPIQSGRGWHLVRVQRREEQREIDRSELGKQLLLDWREQKLAELRRERLDELRGNYRIVQEGASTGG